jgi:hypothetical protein
MRAVGVRKSLREELERAANRPQSASCECLAAPIRLDSGTTAQTAAEVQVRCIAQTCTSVLNPTKAAPEP